MIIQLQVTPGACVPFCAILVCLKTQDRKKEKKEKERKHPVRSPGCLVAIFKATDTAHQQSLLCTNSLPPHWDHSPSPIYSRLRGPHQAETLFNYTWGESALHLSRTTSRQQLLRVMRGHQEQPLRSSGNGRVQPLLAPSTASGHCSGALGGF